MCGENTSELSAVISVSRESVRRTMNASSFAVKKAASSPAWNLPPTGASKLGPLLPGLDELPVPGAALDVRLHEPRLRSPTSWI